jgi:polar amino acid transport system substrate-binding protein
VDTPFEGIQSGEDLNARKCDIAAAAMTITPERQEKIAFSAPYFDANQALLVKKGSGIDSLEALSGKTLGVQSGTTGKMYAEKNAQPAGAELKDYEDLALELSSVKSGQVDAAINDIPVLLDYAKQNPDVEVTAQFKTGEQYGFGMKKGTSDKLEAVVDRILEKAKSDGTYDRIYKKWFGAAPQ